MLPGICCTWEVEPDQRTASLQWEGLWAEKWLFRREFIKQHFVFVPMYQLSEGLIFKGLQEGYIILSYIKTFSKCDLF